MSEKETSLQEKDASTSEDFLETLLSEIEEFNKEALSRSTSNKSRSTNSASSDTHPNLSQDFCITLQDTQQELDATDKSSIFDLSYSEEQLENVEKENVNAEKKLSDYDIGFNINLSESWINSTIPNTKHISSTVQNKKKTPPQCDAKVKISIPLDTYANTPLSNALNCKRPALTSVTKSNGHNTKNDSVEDMERVIIAKNEYIILSLLGQGGNSKVYSCFESVNKYERAIKMISCNSKIAKSLMNEIDIMRHLQDCTSIIKLYSYEVQNKHLYIVLERGYCNLSVIIKEYYYTSERLPFYKLMYYWMEILKAVQQIHSRHIVHLDLKLSNFVQCKNCIKLIDFGTAVIVNDENYAIKYSQIGSVNYVCPEAVTNVASTICDNFNDNIEMFKVTLKSDIWSLGCILYELVYKKPPFHHIIKINDKLSAITDPTHKINYPYSTWAPQKLLEAMKICLMHNPQKRPSIKQLLDYFT